MKKLFITITAICSFSVLAQGNTAGTGNHVVMAITNCELEVHSKLIRGRAEGERIMESKGYKLVPRGSGANLRITFQDKGVYIVEGSTPSTVSKPFTAFLQRRLGQGDNENQQPVWETISEKTDRVFNLNKIKEAFETDFYAPRDMQRSEMRSLRKLPNCTEIDS